jgi:protein TonB
MDYALPNAAFGFSPVALTKAGGRDRVLIAAALISLLIHGIALGWLPGFTGTMSEISHRLQVQLKTPLFQPEPEAVVAVQPTKPASQSTRRESTTEHHEVIPVLTASATPAATDAPSFRIPEAVAPSSVAETAPAREAPRESGAKAVDADLLAGYGRELAGAVAAHRRYPRMALLRQWQGTVMLQLAFAGDGRLSAVRVLSSSGYEILDKQAVDMVRDTTPLPQLPSALAGRPLAVDIPVVFRITS